MKLLNKIFILAAVSTFFISCNTVPEIPADASSTQLIQMGQDAMEFSNYTAAETYYNAVIQRYGMDISAYIEASYELGHLYLAYQKFDEILSTFENAEIGVIPAAYKKLATIGMEQIPAKYKTN